MKFTFSWLQKYLKTKKSLDNICGRLTMLGIEVAEIIDNQNFLKQFKIAEVKEVQDHPNADRLKLCANHIKDNPNYKVIVDVTLNISNKAINWDNSILKKDFFITFSINQ